jgi:hypothetical protein
MIRLRTIFGVVAALTVTGLVLGGCGDEKPVDEPRLLVLDGIEFRLDDVMPYVQFFDSFLPEGGRKTKVQRVLEEYLIPLRLAQRAFPNERQTQKANADGLRSVATNVEELERQTAQVKDKLRANMTRMQALLPVAMFLFDPLRVRAVSDPIELPQGWFVVAAYELFQSPGLQVSDYVDALQVGFVTHTAGEFYKWYEAQKVALASKATFVHPDFVTAMPPWIQPPKQP